MEILKTAGETQVVRQAQAKKRLGRRVFEDAVEAGWLHYCSIKKGARRPHASIFYRLDDIIKVEQKILGGKYPPRKKNK